MERTLIVHVISVKAIKVPDKPKGYQHLSAWQKKNNATSISCCLI